MLCVCLFPALQPVSLGQEWLCNLQKSEKNKNEGPLIQNVSGVAGRQQQSIEQSMGPFCAQSSWNYPGHSRPEAALPQGSEAQT